MDPEPPPPDLYAVLGVRKDAKPDALRKAYRKLARRHHPDANPGDPGAAARYAAASQAYAVLSDPARRARYDATGDTRDHTATELADVATVLVPALMSRLAHMASRFGDPPLERARRTDLVAEIRAAVRERRDGVERQVAEVTANLELVREVAGRFTLAPGTGGAPTDDVFAQSLGAELRRLGEVRDAGRAELDRITRALAYLERVRYATEKRPGRPATVAEQVMALSFLVSRASSSSSSTT